MDTLNTIISAATGAAFGGLASYIVQEYRDRRRRRLDRREKARLILRPLRQAVCGLRAEWHKAGQAEITAAETVVGETLARCAAEMRSLYGSRQLASIGWQYIEYQDARKAGHPNRAVQALAILQLCVDTYRPDCE